MERCYSENEILSLIQQFEARKLPKEEWTHAAHLSVAIWYCRKHPFHEALHLIKGTIRKHNEAVGTLNTDQSGYHETITRFWLLTAYHFLGRNKDMTLTQSCNDFILSELGHSNFPLEFYSRELLFSTIARRGWVEPDLKELDFLLLTSNLVLAS